MQVLFCSAGHYIVYVKSLVKCLWAIPECTAQLIKQAFVAQNRGAPRAVEAD